MAEATLVLYSTLGCHLCEQAETLLQTLPLSAPLAVEVIDIGDDDTLVQLYGARIPVLGWELREAGGEGTVGGEGGAQPARELDWPFDAADVQAFLQDCSR